MSPFKGMIAAATIATIGAVPSRAQEIRPERTVEARTLSSRRDPALTVAFGDGFAWAGAHRFVLKNVADAEQHFFVDADTQKNVKRLYWIQFEKYLDGRGGTYDYSADDPIEIAGLAMRVNVRRMALPPAPDSDRLQAFAFLGRAGYRVSHVGARARFTYVPNAARRTELMVIYFEPAPGEGDVAPEEARALVERGRAGLRITPAK